MDKLVSHVIVTLSTDNMLCKEWVERCEAQAPVIYEAEWHAIYHYTWEVNSQGQGVVRFKLTKVNEPAPEAPAQRRSGMNYSRAVFVINSHLRAVLAVYENHGELPKGPHPKKTMFKTLDKLVAVGDIVVVPTAETNRHGVTTVKVTDVDVRVDLDDPTPVTWVVARVDKKAYEDLLKQEERAVQLIQDGEHNKRRQAILDSIAAVSPELKSLPLYSDDEGKEPPPAPRPRAPSARDQ